MTINWQSVVRNSVHLPRAPAPLTMAGIPAARLNPKFIATLPLQNLWVENGVIWQLPSLLIGFTNYSAVTRFFGSLNGTGMGPPPSTWYQGRPFSASDFPILYDQYEYSKSKRIKPTKANSYSTKFTTVWAGFDCLIWPSIAALPNIKLLMSMVGDHEVTPAHGHAGSAGPVVPITSITNFPANSPAGQKTFSAEYVMYVPGGITAKTSNAGIQWDMSTYCWRSKWITKQYDSGQKPPASQSGGWC